jgi:lysophospholipase L1-like esterase
MPFLDLTPMLRAEVSRGKALNFKLDGHWNAEGHRVAGKAIAEWIEKSDVFPTLLDAQTGD